MAEWLKAHAWKVCDRREVIPGFESLLLRILHCVKNTGIQAILKGLDEAWVSVFLLVYKGFEGALLGATNRGEW